MNIKFGGSSVAPGGFFEYPDADPRWFSHLGVSPDYQIPTDYCESIDLTSLKITALRETLEETGLHLGSEAEIPKSAQGFLDQCIEKQKYPPVEKLHFFARYIPSGQFPQGIELVVYVCAYENNEEIILDPLESSSYEWATPDCFLQKYREAEIMLFPAQLHIMCVLAQYRSVGEVLGANFSKRPLVGYLDTEEMRVFYIGDYRNFFTPQEYRDKECTHVLDLKTGQLKFDSRLEPFFNSFT